MTSFLQLDFELGLDCLKGSNIINLHMRSAFGDSLMRKDKSNQIQRMRLKPLPAIHPVNQQPKRNNQETIMVFGFEQYPFPNEQISQSPLLKTIVNLDLNTSKLQKVIKLVHPNIIGLRKIVRSSPKEANQNSKQRSYYSFYYELIQYSLKDLIEDRNKNINLFNAVRGANLRQILVSVAEYLKEAGIYYLPRLEDIGVHVDGNIKVYIPPNVVFESVYNPNIHRAILAIVEWWEGLNSVPSNPKIKKDKIALNLPPKLSDNGDLEFQEPSMKSSTLERELGELLGDEAEAQAEDPGTTQLKQSTNSYTSELTKLGSIQLEKFKKIDEEVKFLRSRLNNEKTKREYKEIIPQRQIGKSKSSLNIFDSQQISKPKQTPIVKQKIEKQEKSYFPREPIQQNIHTINIYNHPPSPPMTPVFAQFSPKYNHKNKNYQMYYDQNLDPDFFRDQDEEYSQDTYDIDFENQFQMPNTASNGYRNTLFAPPERQLSEYSQHCHKKNRDVWGGTQSKQKGKQQVVQVCNKNVTESAGPLQFKSFVNKIIKPQFLAKKSNIYEDPGEYGEEEGELEIQKKKKEESSSKRPANLLQRPFSTDKGLNDLKKQSNKSVADFTQQDSIRHDFKRINSQHDFNVGKGKFFASQENPIEEKVKKALEKTKNAIALLNRVKSNKSIVKPLAQ